MEWSRVRAKLVRTLNREHREPSEYKLSIVDGDTLVLGSHMDPIQYKWWRSKRTWNDCHYTDRWYPRGRRESLTTQDFISIAGVEPFVWPIGESYYRHQGVGGKADMVVGVRGRELWVWSTWSTSASREWLLTSGCVDEFHDVVRDVLNHSPIVETDVLSLMVLSGVTSSLPRT